MLVMHYIERSCLDGAISYSRSLHAIGPLDIGDRGVGQNILLLAGWLRLSHRKARYCMSKDLYLIFYWPLGWIIYFKLSYVLSCSHWLVLDRYSIQR